MQFIKCTLVLLIGFLPFSATLAKDPGEKVEVFVSSEDPSMAIGGEAPAKAGNMSSGSLESALARGQKNKNYQDLLDPSETFETSSASPADNTNEKVMAKKSDKRVDQQAEKQAEKIGETRLPATQK